MEFFQVDAALKTVSDAALAEAKEMFERIDAVTEYNQQKVLAGFIRHNISESHFVPTTGYGYGDRGRDTLDT
ncbi:MAG: methionine gamma-lyase family protein, partial [Clostridia bacterium]|nr:methionine gamma-lyase family protein [Clostridia bacterium]